MNVRVDWLSLIDDDEEWQWTACLYAYQHPTQRTILYIGKSDGTTVRSRLYGRHKKEFFRWLELRYGSTRARPQRVGEHTEMRCANITSVNSTAWRRIFSATR
jgi:hypothetical protein